MRTVWGFICILDFGTILDWCVMLRGVLRLLGLRVTKFDNQVGNVDFNCEVESEFVIVPCEVYAYIKISFPIIGDALIFIEDIAEMMVMLFTQVFNAKVVYNESK